MSSIMALSTVATHVCNRFRELVSKLSGRFLIVARGLDREQHVPPSLSRQRPPDLQRTSLISNKCPSGSRKNARISPVHSTGGVTNTAPRAERTA
jgi:hypothetical protein